MRRETSQAGNRTRKTCRRFRRGEHAGELGVRSPKVLQAWDRHALFDSGVLSPHRGASPQEFVCGAIVQTAPHAFHVHKARFVLRAHTFEIACAQEQHAQFGVLSRVAIYNCGDTFLLRKKHSPIVAVCIACPLYGRL